MLKKLHHIPRRIPYRQDYYKRNLRYEKFLSTGVAAPSEPGERFLPAPVSPTIEYDRLADEWDRVEFKPTPDQLAEMKQASGVFSQFVSRHLSHKCAMLTHEQTVDLVLSREVRQGFAGYPFACDKEEALSNQQVVDAWIEWDKTLNNDLYFCSALKREMLKESKVKVNGTRLFFAGPLFFYLSCVRRLSAFFDSFSCMPGICITSTFEKGEWDRLIRSLTGKHNWCTDFKQMDAHLFSAMIRCFADSCAEFCEAPASEIHALFDIVINSRILTSQGEVYQKNTGNPSGWLGTITLNTYALFMFMTIWLKRQGLSDDDILDKVKFYLIGDDSVISCDVAVSPRATWEEFGMNVKLDVDYSDPAEVEFCGAHSVIMDGKFVRRPRCKKFLDSLHFVDTQVLNVEYDRAIGYYKEMFPVPELRDHLLKYINYLRLTNPNARLEPPAGPWFWRRLHTGLEGGGRRIAAP